MLMWTFKPMRSGRSLHLAELWAVDWAAEQKANMWHTEHVCNHYCLIILCGTIKLLRLGLAVNSSITFNSLSLTVSCFEGKFTSVDYIILEGIILLDYHFTCRILTCVGKFPLLDSDSIDNGCSVGMTVCLVAYLWHFSQHCSGPAYEGATPTYVVSRLSFLYVGCTLH